VHEIPRNIRVCCTARIYRFASSAGPLSQWCWREAISVEVSIMHDMDLACLTRDLPCTWNRFWMAHPVLMPAHGAFSGLLSCLWQHRAQRAKSVSITRSNHTQCAGPTYVAIDRRGWRGGETRESAREVAAGWRCLGPHHAWPSSLALAALGAKAWPSLPFWPRKCTAPGG
jgi:hypothetical protein